MTYPIAETFYSLQGEGYWVGTPMFFIRLAGCNVGKYVGYGAQKFAEPHVPIVQDKDLPLVYSQQHSVCTTLDGQKFVCDTDYHRHESLEVETLVNMVHDSGARHVCITGGEPFIHDLEQLVGAMSTLGTTVHIETSGTLEIDFSKHTNTWITCSPKANALDTVLTNADEIKLLVSPMLEFRTLEHIFKLRQHLFPTPLVFLQPINGVHETDTDATTRCIELVKRLPGSCRLSVQMHKYWGVR